MVWRGDLENDGLNRLVLRAVLRGRADVAACSTAAAMTAGCVEVPACSVEASAPAISCACEAYGPVPLVSSSPCAAMRPHSDMVLAGSMMDTLIPWGFSSSRSASLRPSTANLVAWYQVPSGS